MPRCNLTDLALASFWNLQEWIPIDFDPFYMTAWQWGNADAEIKVPTGGNTALKRFPFKAWGRSVYSHTCKRLLPDIFSLPICTLPVHSPAFFQSLSRFFVCWLCLTHGSCVGPQNKIGHPAGCRFPCSASAEYK